MAKRVSWGTVVVGGLVLMSGAVTEGAKPAADLPVAVDFGGEQSPGLYSDGTGLYVHGQQNVRAVILANGNFVFDTNDNTRTDGGRRITIDFGGDGVFQADAFLGTIGVTGTAADGNLATMAVGTLLQRRTRIGWSEDGQEYSLRWDGLVPTVGAAPDGYFNFSCTAGSPGACSAWTVTPTGPASLYLMTPSSKGKPAGETLIGQYTIPFAITLTR